MMPRVPRANPEGTDEDRLLPARQTDTDVDEQGRSPESFLPLPSVRCGLLASRRSEHAAAECYLRFGDYLRRGDLLREASLPEDRSRLAWVQTYARDSPYRHGG